MYLLLFIYYSISNNITIISNNKIKAYEARTFMPFL